MQAYKDYVIESGPWELKSTRIMLRLNEQQLQEMKRELKVANIRRATADDYEQGLQPMNIGLTDRMLGPLGVVMSNTDEHSGGNEQ